MGRSGLALAFGTMVKFFPALLVPTFILFLIKKQRPLREIVAFVAAFCIGCVVLLGPFLSGLLYVLAFHGSRVGGGMNWVMLARLGILFPNPNLDAISYAISDFGTPILLIAMLLGYWWAYTKSEMRLNRMILVTLLAFLVGSKLVNEQYALLVFPFALLEARQVGGAWRWFARLLWIVPIAFAVVRVPIERFTWLLYHMIFRSRANVITLTGVDGAAVGFHPLAEPHGGCGADRRAGRGLLAALPGFARLAGAARASLAPLRSAGSGQRATVACGDGQCERRGFPHAAAGVGGKLSDVCMPSREGVATQRLVMSDGHDRDAGQRTRGHPT